MVAPAARRKLQGQQADGSGALNHRNVAEPDAAVLDHAVGDRGRLDLSGILICQTRVRREHPVGLNRDRPRKPSVWRSHLVAPAKLQLHRLTRLWLPGQTRLTSTAGWCHTDHHTVALPHCFHLGADCANRARPLVAADCRTVQVTRAIRSDVRAADAAVGDVDHHTRGTCDWRVELEELEPFPARDERDFHAAIPSVRLRARDTGAVN